MMKKINLKKYCKIDNIYVVKLGNGYGFEFLQEKKAQTFLKKINKHLTEQLYFINEVYASVYYTYRQNYLLFTPNSNLRQQNILQAERKINDLSNGIVSNLMKAVNMSGTENGNFIVYASIYYCLYALRSICMELNRVVERQKLTTLKYQIISYHQQINNIESELNKYEQTKAVIHFDKAKVIDLELVNMSKVI